MISLQDWRQQLVEFSGPIGQIDPNGQSPSPDLRHGSPYLGLSPRLPAKRVSGANETVTKPFRVGEEGRWAKDRLKNFLKISFGE